MNFQKTIILPLLSSIAFAVDFIWHVKIPEDILSQAGLFIGGAITLGLNIYGIIKNHKKEVDQDVSNH